MAIGFPRNPSSSAAPGMTDCDAVFGWSGGVEARQLQGYASQPLISGWVGLGLEGGCVGGGRIRERRVFFGGEGGVLW